MSNTHNRKKKSRKGQQFNKQTTLQKIERAEHPPMIPAYELFQQRKFRFTVTAATPAAGTVFTYQNLLDLMLIADTAIHGFELFDLVRIEQVQVWSAAALGTPTTVGVSFVTTTGDRSLHTDTSLGVKPSYVSAFPSRESLASFFQLSGAGNAFLIQAPAGSIVDLTLHLKTASVAPTAAANPLVGATIGEFYFRGLDGLATAGTNFPPINGVLTI